MIKLDGSFGEGGGQIVRTALALSALTQKPFEVNNIRKGRCSSGLKAQHLHCIKSLQELTNAKTNEVNIGSEYLRFIAGKFQAKNIDIDIRTAGSVTLLLQSLLLPCMFGDKKIKLTITGGTDGKWAMPFDYFNNVFVSQMKKYADIDVKLIKRGYYPKGGGKIELNIKPNYDAAGYKDFGTFWNHLKNEDKKINLMDRRNLLQIKGISHASKDLEKAEVSERQAKSAELLLKKYNCDIDIRTEYCNTLSAGSGIVLWAKFDNAVLGADGLGERGKKAELVGEEAAKNLMKEIDSKAAVDKYLADNILPFIALFGGKINASEITDHCKTNIYVIEKFLGKCFDVDEGNKTITFINH